MWWHTIHTWPYWRVVAAENHQTTSHHKDSKLLFSIMRKHEVWTKNCDGTIFSISSCLTVFWTVHQLSRGGSPLSDPTVGGLFNPTSPFIFWLCLLCAACLSHHKSPTGQPVFTLPMRHGLSPQQPATPPPPSPRLPTHPKRTIFSLFSPQPADCPTVHCSQSTLSACCMGTL